MANVFNAAEVIDMGIEKEKKRMEFYGLAAFTFKEHELKELFQKLRDWEETHIKKFTAIRNSVTDEEIQESYQGEFTAYLKATVDDMLYKQVSASEFSKNVKSPLDAINYGISFEKDAVLFFNELIEYMPSTHKDKVRELVEEEKKHIIYLSDLRKTYIR